MLYAPIHKEEWGNALPVNWDKSQIMFHHLNKMTNYVSGYQLVFEQRMFCSPLEKKFRCQLVQWRDDGLVRKRDVLLETTEPEQMEAALFMLITTFEDARKHDAK